LASLELNELGLRFPNLIYLPVPGQNGEGIARQARTSGVDLLALPVPAEGLSLWDRVFKHPLETVMRRPPCAMLFCRPPEDPAEEPGGTGAGEAGKAPLSTLL
jgi:hypothetical protein